MPPSTLHPFARRFVSATLSHHRRNASTSILFALSSLSNSRETQHFSKITRLSLVEHSPSLKLIQSGEIDPFSRAEPKRAVPGKSRATDHLFDRRATSVGRAILAQQARRTVNLQRALSRSQRRESLRLVQLEQVQSQWRRQERKMRAEMRTAGLWILASVCTATGLAMWRFWPEARMPGVDSGELGRRLARKAGVAPAASTADSTVMVSDMSTTPTTIGATGTHLFGSPAGIVPQTAPVAIVPNVQTGSEAVDSRAPSSMVKSLFWKQL